MATASPRLARRIRAHPGLGFWANMSSHAYALFLLAVFCLFASFGFIGAAGAGVPWPHVLADAFFSGFVAAVCALLGTRGLYLWIAVFVVAAMFGWPLAESVLLPPAASQPTHSLDFAAIAAIVAVIAGYVLFLLFIGTQGRRHLRLQTEIDLAGEIHRAMAPAIDRRLGRFEFSGVSHASGQVGGDLLDLAEAGGSWLAYITDVSGHGVGAGVLMGVVKSAAHTWLASAGPGGLASRERFEHGLLPDLNRVLVNLLPAEKYVTMAALMYGADGELCYAAVGHPPLLHYHAASGEVTQQGVQNFPLGMFPVAAFASVPVACAPGDMVAIFTDGLDEIFDRQQHEFGIEGLSTALRQSARLPLAEAQASIITAARAFGPQQDDQTLLLIRCT